MAEVGTFFDIVHSLDDVLLGEPPDDVLFVFPELQDGCLQTLVIESLDEIAINVGRKLVQDVGVVIDGITT